MFEAGKSVREIGLPACLSAANRAISERQGRKTTKAVATGWLAAISHTLRTKKRSHERKTITEGASLATETVDEEAVRSKAAGRLPIGRRLPTCPTSASESMRRWRVSGKCARHNGLVAQFFMGFRGPKAHSARPGGLSYIE